MKTTKQQPTKQQFDETARQLRTANLRLEAIRMVLSPRTGRLALHRMIQGGAAGRREASEIGRRIYQQKRGESDAKPKTQPAEKE